MRAHPPSDNVQAKLKVSDLHSPLSQLLTDLIGSAEIASQRLSRNHAACGSGSAWQASSRTL